jgi:hypothetical protein
LGMNTAAYGLEDFGEVDFFVCLIHIHINLAVPHQSFWLVYELLVQLHIMLCYIKLAISFPRLFDRFGQWTYIKLSVFCSQEQIGVASGS